MTQRTVVVALSRDQALELERALEQAPFEFRAVPHARVSVRTPDAVATLYRSGKLVVQGANPDAFFERYLGAAPKPQASTADETTVGSDESGKGDYFGPLVVAGVRLDLETARALAGGSVRDSKTLSDETCLRLGAALRGTVPHAIEVLDPSVYNVEHRRMGNLNPLLAHLHGRVIRKLASPGMLVVVDQFGPERLVASEVADLDIRLVQRPRAEEIPAVAAASVIAREQFLVRLRELGEQHGIDLAKGAGEPADRAARRFVALRGFDKLAEVAKLHFKTTQKIAPRP